jgi:CRP/FNR family transcriptional regulator, nitrogen oxide reductase regulator
MTASELASFVKRLRPPFLQDLGAEEFNAVLSAARQQRFLAKSVITNQGHPANHIYMILTGAARSFFLTQAGHRLHVYSYPAGEMFGGMALVARHSEYLVSTEATKDTYTLIWDRTNIRRLILRYPQMMDNSLSIASEYLNVSIANQVALSCHSARQRLAEVLVSMASGIGRRAPSGIEVTVRNEELAAAANVTTFTVSRTMSEWQRAGLLSKTRGKVLLTFPERLLLQDL